MHVPTHVFREYDIRGKADGDLTSDLVHALGLAFATELGADERPLRVVVARDCRLSGPRLHEALVSGLTRCGVTVEDIGVGPTPFLYAAVHGLSADGGIMITGSHNPGDENGFKMMRGKQSFFGASIQSLMTRIREKSFAKDRPGSVRAVDFADRYIQRVTEGIHLPKKDLRFVIDAGNGAGGPLALRAMKALGLSPDPLFCEMDGRFPNHHPDPTVPKNMEALISRVKGAGARLGIAYDGDADRLGAVDEGGEIIWGDKLMILFSRALLRERPGAKILGEVKCSQTLYNDIALHGGTPIVWKTGHSLIKTKMKEEGALLAGEMSGHLFFADRYDGFDDAIYASLRLLEIVSSDPRSLSAMLADVPKTYATPEIRLDCEDATKFEVVRRITELYASRGHKVDTTDGARIQFVEAPAIAWGLVRASNTGPVLVLRFEAESEESLREIARDVETSVATLRKELATARA